MWALDAASVSTPVWQSDKLPTPLMKFTSQSWHTISGLVGMFEHIAEQAAQLGVESPSLYGMPFEMVLVNKTDPVKRHRFRWCDFPQR